MCRMEDSDDDIFSSNNDHTGDRRSRRGDGEGDGGELTREVMLAKTGSAVSSTLMEDTVHSPFAVQKEEMIELSEKLKQSHCDFLWHHFLCADEDMRNMCTQLDAEKGSKASRRQAKRRRAGVVCTICNGGMGVFDLSNTQLKCLKGNEWLDDEDDVEVGQRVPQHTLPAVLQSEGEGGGGGQKLSRSSGGGFKPVTPPGSPPPGDGGRAQTLSRKERRKLQYGNASRVVVLAEQQYYKCATLNCTNPKIRLVKDDFSNSQFEKGEHHRKCAYCVKAMATQGTAHNWTPPGSNLHYHT